MFSPGTKLDRSIQYSRDVGDAMDRPWCTGCPHTRGMTAAGGARFYSSFQRQAAKPLQFRAKVVVGRLPNGLKSVV